MSKSNEGSCTPDQDNANQSPGVNDARWDDSLRKYTDEEIADFPNRDRLDGAAQAIVACFPNIPP
jgi:hypothetical protein